MKRLFGGSHKFWMIAIGLAGMLFITFQAACDGGGSPGPGCGGSNQFTSGSPGFSYASVSVKAELISINPKTAYLPGEQKQTRLKATLNTDGNVSFTWYPPTGATGLTFPAGITRQAGGPPYVFNNLTATQAGTGFLVSYSMPTSGTNATEQLTVNQVVDTRLYQDTTSIQYTLSPLGGVPVVLSGSSETGKTRGPAPMVWDLYQNNDFSIPLTPLYCQALIAQAQSANIFVALRAPVADALQDNVSYSSPVVFGGFTPPVTTLTADGLNTSMPMITRPEMAAWANANLPASAGELWTALAVNPDTDLTNGCANASGQAKFSLGTMIEIDLSNRPNSCTGCVVSSYFCYKTGLLPGAWARLLKAGRDSLAFGEYTCLGPDDTSLNEFGNWSLTDFTASQVLQPGDPILLHYYLYNSDGNPRTFHFSSFDSPLAVTNWAVHPSVIGDPNTPDLGQTITGNFTVPASSEYELYITGTVPAGAAPNNYPFHLTVAGDAMDPATRTGGSTLIVTINGELPAIGEAVPGVSLAGSAFPTAAHRGANITYTFTVTNTGSSSLSNLVLHDTLPANTTYISCQGADSCGLASGVITWNLANLGTSQQVILTLTVRINANTPPATTVIHNSTYSLTTTEASTAIGTGIDVTVTPFLQYITILFK